jgi:hypothetical protein
MNGLPASGRLAAQARRARPRGRTPITALARRNE